MRSDILALELILCDLGFNCPLCSDPVSFIFAATVLSLLILFPVDWVKCEVTDNDPSRTISWSLYPFVTANIRLLSNNLRCRIIRGGEE